MPFCAVRCYLDRASLTPKPIKNTPAIFWSMDVTRGLQTFARDLQAVPGRVVEVGHSEGWGFQSGDTIRLSNPSFDPVSFAAP